jgi:trimethylamine--corrinoid protein Co-methyltransferase
MLGDYTPPPLDEGLRDSLVDFVARKKASVPDAFV